MPDVTAAKTSAIVREGMRLGWGFVGGFGGDGGGGVVKTSRAAFGMSECGWRLCMWAEGMGVVAAVVVHYRAKAAIQTWRMKPDTVTEEDFWTRQTYTRHYIMWCNGIRSFFFSSLFSHSTIVIINYSPEDWHVELLTWWVYDASGPR